jgi:hypothetical protein
VNGRRSGRPYPFGEGRKLLQLRGRAHFEFVSLPRHVERGGTHYISSSPSQIQAREEANFVFNFSICMKVKMSSPASGKNFYAIREFPVALYSVFKRNLAAVCWVHIKDCKSIATGDTDISKREFFPPLVNNSLVGSSSLDAVFI